MLLENRVAVITGCNRGIGKQILQLFSENGANIFACVRKIDNDFLNEIKKIKEKNKNNIFPIELNLSDHEMIKKAYDEIISKNNNIDVLVNNSGIIHTASFNMTSEKKLKEIFEINYFSQFKLTQYFAKTMIKNKKGSIIFISSTSGIDADEGRGAYSSSKGALISLSKNLSKELGVYNIRVNTLAPGLINTDMLKNHTKESIINDIVNRLPLKRVGNTDDVAKSALFLASDLSSYITGQVLRVDGGM